MPNPEDEPKISKISVSQPLEDAILISSRDLNGQPLDVPHLLLAVLAQEGLGRRSMEVVSKGFTTTSDIVKSLHGEQEDGVDVGKINVNGREIAVTNKVAALIEEAGLRAKGSLYVDTGHLIQAELSRISSVLNSVFASKNSSRTEIGPVLSKYIEIARKEKKYPQEPAAGSPIEAEPVKIDNKEIVDLLADAKEKAGDDIFVNPEWTVALIQSVTSNPITVIMTEHKEEASMAVAGLAVELAKNGSSYKDIPKIIVPSLSALIEDPDGIIAASVREAAGGVLVLPDDPRLLTHRAVRLALERKSIRVLSFAEESVWIKSKSTSAKIDAHELYLSPPTEATLFDILKARKKTLEAQYGSNGYAITISNAAFREAAKLGYRYASVMNASSVLAAGKLLETAATNLKIVHSGMRKLLPFKIKDDNIIDETDVYLALKTVTGIEIQPENPARFLEMEAELGKQIIGQEEAIKIVSDTIRRSETALRDPGRPGGVFMFLGPSGVGKTELAKALNDFLFHDDRSFIQLNMSEYQEQHSVARLIGSPPGYVGYEEGGQLTEKVRKQPYSIVVVDEVEKANAKVFDLFLQVFEEGTLTDGKGRTVDFSNTIVILTGNIGSEYFDDLATRGFESIKNDVLKEARHVFRPEFLNRIDNIVVFKSLSPEALSRIVDLQVEKLNKRLAESKIKIELTPEMHKFLEKVGYDPKYGARPLRRAVETHVGNGITPKLLSKEFKAGDVVIADYKEGKVTLVQKQ
jgi:ATP-dependent Clp protease ATP-binding subunit ClpA